MQTIVCVTPGVYLSRNRENRKRPLVWYSFAETVLIVELILENLVRIVKHVLYFEAQKTGQKIFSIINIDRIRINFKNPAQILT